MSTSRVCMYALTCLAAWLSGAAFADTVQIMLQAAHPDASMYDRAVGVIRCETDDMMDIDASRARTRPLSYISASTGLAHGLESPVMQMLRYNRVSKLSSGLSQDFNTMIDVTDNTVQVHLNNEAWEMTFPEIDNKGLNVCDPDTSSAASFAANDSGFEDGALRAGGFNAATTFDTLLLSQFAPHAGAPGKFTMDDGLEGGWRDGPGSEPATTDPRLKRSKAVRPLPAGRTRRAS